MTIEYGDYPVPKKSGSRERTVAFASMCIWLIVLFLFGSVVLTMEVLPRPESVPFFDPNYDAYLEASRAALVSSLVFLFSLVISIVALVMVLRKFSKWWTLGGK